MAATGTLAAVAVTVLAVMVAVVLAVQRRLARAGAEPAAASDEHGNRKGKLVVDVRDDGPGGAQASGHGLTLLAERVASVGGTMQLTSPVGQGTAIHAIMPFHPPALSTPI
jgi:signal transduction histidine kinase